MFVGRRTRRGGCEIFPLVSFAKADLPPPPYSNKYMWYDPANSYNPAIHRLKDAVYHQATTADLDADPMPPPHPALLKFLDPPEAIVKRSEATVAKLKEVLDIKAVPPAVKKGERKPAEQGRPNAE